MKHVTRLALFLFLFAMLFSTWSVADSGGDTFKGKCAMCHGATGKGDTSMGKAKGLRDLGSADVQAQSDADLAKIINDGKGAMPKYDGKLTKEQIDEVVKFIRTLKH